MTQHALVAYAVGLLGIILVKVLAPGFYARQNIKTPVKIALFTLVSTQLMNLVFIGPLKHAGLALAISLAACLNAGLLFWQLRKQQLFEPQAGWGKFIAKLVVSVLVMCAALIGMMHFMPAWDQGGMPIRLVRLGALVVAGVVAYFGMLAILGFRLRDFSRRAVL
jgi:putative peptidoglycan lipid II flippase